MRAITLDLTSENCFNTIPGSYGDYPAIRLYTKRMTCQSLGFDFGELVSLTQSCNLRMQATDRRDHIFPLLTLATCKISETLQMQLDYSLSFPKVYIPTTLALLQTGYTGILVLAMIRRNRIKTDVLPSWVPDYSEGGEVTGLITRSRDAPVFDYTYIDNDVHVLSMAGTTFGPVETICTEEWLAARLESRHQNLHNHQTLSQHQACLLSIGHALRCKGLSDIGVRQRALACSILYAYSPLFRQNTPDAYISLNFQYDNRLPHDSALNSLVLISEALAGSGAVGFKEAFGSLLEQDPDFRAWFPGAPSPHNWAELHEFLDRANRYPAREDLAERKLDALRSFVWCESKIRAYQLLDDIAGEVISLYTPFVCQEYVGVGSKEMRTGDILSVVDCDPDTLLILRNFGDGLVKIVGWAFVAQLWRSRGHMEMRGTRTAFRLC
jgi:hypothetical protein